MLSMAAEFSFGSDTNLSHFTDEVYEMGGTVIDTDYSQRAVKVEGVNDREAVAEAALRWGAEVRQ